jgi:hypothetical protein
MREPKRLSLRQVFHKQGNLHQLVMLTVALIGKYLKNILEQEELRQEVKAVLQESACQLQKAEEITLKADELRSKIKEIVYQKINPDQIEVDIKED